MAEVMIFERAIAQGSSRRRAAVPAPACRIVRQEHPWWPSMAPLCEAMARAECGDCVAFAVALDTAPIKRLLTLATLRWQRRRAERAIRRSGGEVVGQFGVDPSLADPSWLYELNTPASAYADRFMRPRGSNLALRRLAGWCFGCDPALGGVMVVGKKAC